MFLVALRGLAAVSHILAQDALDAVNKIEDCSESFTPVFDVDTLNRKLQCNMKELETRFAAASDREAYEVIYIMPIYLALFGTIFFLSLYYI